jgi:hypothetical protein
MFLILLLCAVILLVWHHKKETYTDLPMLCNTQGKIVSLTNEQTAFLLTARVLVKTLLDHLEKQTKSKNAKEILNWMTPENVFLFNDAGTSGRMRRVKRRRKACMFINPDGITSVGRLQAIICHELAHLTGNQHDMKWRDTNKYLLNLTSRDLGWKNELECGSCRKYNICKKKFCPRCTWLEGDHSTCAPVNKRGTALN